MGGPVVGPRAGAVGRRGVGYWRANPEEEAPCPDSARSTTASARRRSRFPPKYNAAHDLIERNLAAGRAAKTAYIDDAGRCTFGELAERVNRAANALTQLGLGIDDRLMLCHLDTVDWVAVFLGAIKAGIVPIAVNTLLTPGDYEFMLNDSRAKALVVSEQLWPQFAPVLDRCPHVKHVVVSGANAQGRPRLQDLLAASGHVIRDRADEPRRPVLLAVLVGIDRHAKGHRAHPDEHALHGRALRAPGARDSHRRRGVLGREALLRVRPRQFAQLPARRRRDDRTDGGAAHARGGVQAPQGASADDLLRRAHALRRAARESGAAEEAGAEGARLCLGRRSAARGPRPALDRALRGRDPGRHRLDRDAAYLPFEPSRRGALRDERQGGAWLPAPHRRRAGRRTPASTRSAISSSPARPPPQATGTTASAPVRPSSASGPAPATSTSSARTATTPTAAAPTTCSRSGGIFVSPFEVEAALLTHPDVLEAAVVGIPDETAADQAEGVHRDEAGGAGVADAGRRAETAREGSAGALQVPALGRVRARPAEDRDRQDPALQAPPARRRLGRRRLEIPAAAPTYLKG